MLTWPNPDTDWRPYIDEITSTYLTLSKVIAARERLVIAAKDAAYVKTLLRDSLTEAEMARVTVVACDINDTWARDHGPITLRSGKDGSLKLLDFRFNGWGEKFSWQKTMPSLLRFMAKACSRPHWRATTTSCLRAAQ